MELVAQVCEFVRGSKSVAERRVAQFSGVCVDFTAMTVSRLSGDVIPLTYQEFKTLRCFLSNPERVLSRDELLNSAWGYANYPLTRTVDTSTIMWPNYARNWKTTRPNRFTFGRFTESATNSCPEELARSGFRRRSQKPVLSGWATLTRQK
jgi:hypothetical protein